MPVQTMARTAVRRKSAIATRTATSRGSAAKNAASSQKAKASTKSVAGVNSYRAYQLHLGRQVAQATAAQPGASAVCWQRGGCPGQGARTPRL